MPRYQLVLIYSSGERVDLIVPCNEQMLCSGLVSKGIDRAAKYTKTILSQTLIELRLGSPTGFLIDADDKVEDVLEVTDILYVLEKKSETIDIQTLPDSLANTTTTIRILTPPRALPSAEIRNRTLLHNGQPIQNLTPLIELKAAIAAHLGISLQQTDHHSLGQECNCALADLLVERGQWQKILHPGACLSQKESESDLRTENLLFVQECCALCSKDLSTHSPKSGMLVDTDAFVLVRTDVGCGHMLHSTCLENDTKTWICPETCKQILPIFTCKQRILVVFDKGCSEEVDIVYATPGGIIAALEARFGNDHIATKTVHMKGGIQREKSDVYEHLPLVSICSQYRHTSQPYKTSADPSDVVKLELDLHTTEGPIDGDLQELTIENTNLHQLAVDGVLTIFAVERKSSSMDSVKSGQDAIFAASACWQLSPDQSERGTASALACLRVFAHTVSGNDFEDYHHNELLRTFHLLTGFPPAVRAMYMLITGRTLRPIESAALIQSIAAVLSEIIPTSTIDHDCGRFLEASRLLLGYLLHTLRVFDSHTELRDSDQKNMETSLPWIEALRTIDLKDCHTLEKVIHPILTTFGLMESASYETLRNHGLDRILSTYVQALSNCDSRTLRLAYLSGGRNDEVPYYDADMLMGSFSRVAVCSNILAELKLLSRDLQNLALSCEESKFSVVAPRQLASAEHPCLTMDSQGYLAVYTGIHPCAPPDRNKAIYRPLLGKEERVDANVLTQVLEPILDARKLDGTAVFDLFTSSFKHKDTTPSELLVLAVDISQSMNRCSEFYDQEADESSLSSIKPAVAILADANDAPILFAEVRSFVEDHESFDDMLAIIDATPSRDVESTILEILHLLTKLTSRELDSLADTVRESQAWATAAYQSSTSRPALRMGALQRIRSGLVKHRKPLCVLLEFCGKHNGFKPTPFVYSYGEEIPDVSPLTKAAAPTDIARLCTIPQEYVCPIKRSGVMDDPVSTSDHTGPYERQSIEKWLKKSDLSPLTGLPLPNKSLIHNHSLAARIKKWIDGDDNVTPLMNRKKRKVIRLNVRYTKLTFVGPLGAFYRAVAPQTSLADLYMLAFKGMKGVNHNFRLSIPGNMLACSNMTVAERGLKNEQEITISTETKSPTPSHEHGMKQREMCLLKVYLHFDKDARELFAYWVPRNTPVTLGSIIFRCWHYHKSRGQHWSTDVEVWYNLRHKGDSTLSGDSSGCWNLVSRQLDTLKPIPLHPNEHLCATQQNAQVPPPVVPLKRGFSTTLQDENDADNSNGRCETGMKECDGRGSDIQVSQNYRVLKVALLRYQDPAEITRWRRTRMRVLTRMGITKNIFSAFINRLIAYNYSTHVGLVVFGTNTELKQRLTHVIENFRIAIDGITPHGDTQLWDGLSSAAEHLMEVSQTFPNAKKRILCLSDGEDTASTMTAASLARTLAQHEIVVDSCSIGQTDNGGLRALSYLTGGYKFAPTRLEDAVAICELEPVLSIDERPAISRPFAHDLITDGIFAEAILRAEPDEINRYIYPARKEHPNLHDSFVHIVSLTKTTSSVSDNISNGVTASNTRCRRILSEIRGLVTNPHPFYDVYVSETDTSFWKVVLQGPDSSAYESGTFVLYLHMGENYPKEAPSGRFVTKIFHPNINKHGRICHSIFDRNWTLDTTNKQILDTVFGLMLVPEFTDPINTVVTLDYYWDEVAFKAEVEKHIEKYAKKGRVELGKEILGEV